MTTGGSPIDRTGVGSEVSGGDRDSDLVGGGAGPQDEIRSGDAAPEHEPGPATLDPTPRGAAAGEPLPETFQPGEGPGPTPGE